MSKLTSLLASCRDLFGSKQEILVADLRDNFGLTEIGSVGSRMTFKDPDAVQFDVYHNDHRVDLLEITLEEETAGDLSADDFEDTEIDFFRRFEDAVSEVSGILGKPTFNDGAGSARFPSDQEAVWLALWSLPPWRFMVQQKNEGREFPFRICLVIADSRGTT